MRKQRFERSYRDTLPVVGVRTMETSNFRVLGASVAKVGLDCPICGIRFERYACWVKRVNVSYCSRACSYEGHKVVVLQDCVICGKEMELSPVEATRKVTCSRVCLRLKRLRGGSHGVLEYKAEAARMVERGVCACCGVNHGPWFVVGLVVTREVGSLPTVSAANARLLCKKCRFAEHNKYVVGLPQTQAYFNRGKALADAPEPRPSDHQIRDVIFRDVIFPVPK